MVEAAVFDSIVAKKKSKLKIEENNVPELNSDEKAKINEIPELNFAEKSPPTKTDPLNKTMSKQKMLDIDPQKFQKVESMTNEVLDFLVKDMLEDDDFLNCLVKKDPKNRNAYDGIFKINSDVEEYLQVLIEKLNTEFFESVHKNLNVP